MWSKVAWISFAALGAGLSAEPAVAHLSGQPHLHAEPALGALAIALVVGITGLVRGRR